MKRTTKKPLIITCSLVALVGIVLAIVTLSGGFGGKDGPSSLPADLVIPDYSEEPGREEPTQSSSEESDSAAGSSAPAVTYPPVTYPSSGSSGPSSSSGSSAEEAGPAVTYSTAGTYSKEETLSNVVITAGNVTVENKTVTGDLEIDVTDQNAVITLKNVTVDGTIIVSGGKELVLEDVTADTIEVYKELERVTLTAYGDTNIKLVEVRSSLNLVETNLSSEAEGFIDVKTQPSDYLYIIVKLKNTQLRMLTANAYTVMERDGTARIGTLVANAAVNIGKVSVEYLQVNADGVRYIQKPGEISVKSGVRSPQREYDDGSYDDEDEEDERYDAPFNLKATISADGYVTVNFDVDGKIARYYSYKIINPGGSIFASGTLRWTNLPLTVSRQLTEAGTYTVEVYGQGSSGYKKSTTTTASFVWGLVELTAPANLIAGYSGSALTASWDAVAGAQSYSVTVVKPDGSTVNASIPADTTSYSLTLSGISGTVQVSVKAVGDGTAYSDSPEAAASIVLTTPLAAPTGLSVTVNESDLQVTWNEVTNGLVYRVNILCPDGQTKAYDTTGTSYPITGILTQTGNYVVTVHARKNGNYSDSPASAAHTVRKLSVPENISITASGNDLLVSWKLPEGATGQDITMIRRPPSGASETVTLSNLAFDGTTGIYTMKAVGAAIKPGTYTVSISARGDMNTSPSDTATASTIRTQQLSAPSDVQLTLGASNITVTWTNADPQARQHVIQYKPAGGTTQTYTVSMGVTSFELSDTAPTTPGVYTVTITAKEYGSYYTASAAAADTKTLRSTLAAPQVSAAVSGNDIVAQWAAVPNASSYRIRVNGGAWTSITQAGTMVTHTLSNAAVAAGNYTVEVQALGTGYYDNSALGSFVITK